MTNRALRPSLFLLFAALLPASLAGQTATVRVKDNLRAEPDGEVVAALEPGTTLTVSGQRDRWLEVDLESWVWLLSLQVAAPSAKNGNYDLIVSVAEGENLRAKPSGPIVGHVAKGTLLDEQERIPGWVRARRKGWIAAASVDVKGSAPAAATTDAPAAATASSAASTAKPTTASTAKGGSAALAPAAGGPATAAVAILSGPNGDTLALTRPGAQVQVVARQGNWAKVRVDGWAWLPGLDSTGIVSVVKLDAAALAADPESYRGRVVSWDLQYLSVERAEKIRTDFFEGEPFLLTRHSGGGYVYVAVPPERLAEMRALLPLERITVVGRVRTPAAALTGSPILDLLELSRTADR